MGPSIKYVPSKSAKFGPHPILVIKNLISEVLHIKLTKINNKLIKRKIIL